MNLSSPSIEEISLEFHRIIAELNQVPGAREDRESGPALSELGEAMREVLDILRYQGQDGPGKTFASDAPQVMSEQDLDRLGEYAVSLLIDLSALAAVCHRPALSQELEALSLPLSLWIGRAGGELRILEPVVNTLAREANSIREPLALARLYALTGEIQDAVSDKLRQDLEKSDPTRPWRILLLNRAIIATRSHQPALIRAAYDDLIAHLPDEAADFFREGMQQMVALNYPQPVREVVENYYNQWSSGRTLH